MAEKKISTVANIEKIHRGWVFYKNSWLRLFNSKGGLNKHVKRVYHVGLWELTFKINADGQ